ncbi:MAG: VWA domain-containing protein [Armatimonadetes bacterium]|nr:VWA domain-containing protein [Armatimonadota bacterium]
MRFTQPFYLLLLLPALGALYYSFAHVHGMARGRKRLAFCLRFLLASSLVLALSGPQARRPNQGVCTIFLLDRSDSVTEADRASSEAFIDDAIRKLPPNDVAGVIAFGKDAVIESAPAARRIAPKVLSQVDGAATDIAAAVRLASASFPEGKARRVVILSDGNETSGDAAGVGEVAAAENIQLDYVPLGLNKRAGEASVSALEIPSEVRSEQPFDLHAVIDSNIDQTGTLDIDRDGAIIKKLPVHLTAGRSSFVVSDKVHDSGFHRYRATLHVPQDQDQRNNIGLGFVSVHGQPHILILQEKPNSSALADALKKNGLDVEVGGPGNAPSRTEDLLRYDAVILNDFNANSFTVQQMALIRDNVRDSGMGLMMVGGENSFLPGGYYGSPIIDALPVDLNIRQRRTFPTTSVGIMVDASGSMGMLEDGIEKIRLAGKAAEETVKLLSPLDRVGVAGSTDGIEWVAPMQVLTNKASVISQIQKLYVGGGGIYARPSMANGEEMMMKEPSQVRHFILLADGDDVDEQDGALAIAARMRANKITTSVVAIGDGKDVKFLQKLAAVGGGQYFLAKKASNLPAIMTQDTSLIARSAIEEGAFIPKIVAGEESLRGFDQTGVPPLLAYCLTDIRPLARAGMWTQKDDPLLARWQYGLGTTIAFTSDAQPRWATKWVPWSGFGAFWSQLSREVLRRSTLNSYQVDVKQVGGKGVITLKATDKYGNPVSSNQADVRVGLPGGEFRDVTVTQTAPGEFAGSFEAAGTGTYIVTVTEPDGQGGKRASTTGFSIPYSPEYQTVKPNTPLLARLGAMTGGLALVKPEDSLRPAVRAGQSITDLWPALLLFAALLLPVDVGVRRLALPVGEIFTKLKARLRRKPTENKGQEVVIDRLISAKQRAAGDDSAARPAAAERVVLPSSGTTPPRSAVGAGVSAAQSLLEAKRRRDNKS